MTNGKFGMAKTKTMVQMSPEFEVDWEFLTIADLQDYTQDLIEQALDSFEETTFDVFAYQNMFNGNDKGMHFMIHKIF